MTAGIIDRIEARLAPHANAISIAAVLWFWLGVALNAGFVPLPDVPRPLRTALFWSGVVANAVWWGWLRRAIESRRVARESAERIVTPPQA